MKSNATTVEAYLKELSEDRVSQIAVVRDVILKNLPAGYEETMNWGIISYQRPLHVYPDTYNKQPLLLAALASQKNHMAIYLSGLYLFEKLYNDFEIAYRKTGKRFDVGKSCVRFKKLDNLPLDLIGSTIAALPVASFIARVKQVHSPRKGRQI